MESLTTKYYCFEGISMPLICDVDDKIVLVVHSKRKNARLNGYKNAFGFPTLTLAKADADNRSEKGKYLVSFYKLRKTRPKC